MFQKPFSFDGRIRRAEFCLSFISYWLFLFAVIILTDEPGFKASLILLLAYIPGLWFLGAQGTKRCHDLGKSGWWLVIPFYAFWMFFQNGQPHSNEYGENPKMLNPAYNPDVLAKVMTDDVDEDVVEDVMEDVVFEENGW